MNSVIKTIIGITLGTLSVAGAAHAHYLWIEPSDNGAKLYYGEADALLKEKSPGKLDNNTSRRGQYVVHVLHVDKTPGEFAGKKYDALRNHFTYTCLKTEGTDPGPAMPPKHGME